MNSTIFAVFEDRLMNKIIIHKDTSGGKSRYRMIVDTPGGECKFLPASFLFRHKEIVVALLATAEALVRDHGVDVEVCERAD